MPAFPLFTDIEGKNCIIFGGGKVAERKIKTLLQFGIHLYVYATDFTDEIKNLASTHKIHIFQMEIMGAEDDFKNIILSKNAYMVICALKNVELNHKIALFCKENHIEVNSATSAKDSSFIFPSVVVREEVCVGITTSGHTPSLTKEIRQMMEMFLPEWYGSLEKQLMEIRSDLQNCLEKQTQRAKVMQILTKYGMTHEGDLPKNLIDQVIEKVEKDEE